MIVIFFFPLFLVLLFSASFFMIASVAKSKDNIKIFHYVTPFIFLLSLVALFLHLTSVEGWDPELAFSPTDRQPAVEVAAYALLALAVPVGWLQFRLERWTVERMRGSRKSPTWQLDNSGRLPAALVLLPAVVLEELIWRGYLIPALVDHLDMTALAAVFLSSVAFGLHHFAFGRGQVLLKSGHGLIWAALAFASGALIAPIIAHAAFNFLALYSERKSRDDPARPAQSAVGRTEALREQ